MIVGVTGPSGSGKSLFARYMGDSGYHILDCDLIYREITSHPSQCTEEIRCAPEFGPAFLLPSGAIDRRALSDAVFAPGAEKILAVLNRITHKYVLDEVRHKIEQAEKSYIGFVVDAPLLIESGFDRECSITAAVLAPYTEKLERIMLRDGITKDRAAARLAAAKQDHFYLSHCDYVFYNDSDLSALRRHAYGFAELCSRQTRR